MAIEKPDYAHEIKAKLLAIKAEVTTRFFAIGMLLREIREGKLWASLGYESFVDFLGDPEVSMRRSSAFRMIGLYETFMLKLKAAENEVTLADIDMQKLEMIRSVVTPENWKEWVARARMLSRSDLRMMVNEARGKGVPALPGPVTVSEPRGYAHENAQLSALMGQIVTEVSMAETGLVIRGDAGTVVRVWAAGNELRVDVSEPVRDLPPQHEESQTAAPVGWAEED